MEEATKKRNRSKPNHKWEQEIPNTGARLEVCSRNPTKMSKALPIDKISNQIGYLVLKDDGAVLESGGELENDEKSANIIMGLIQMTESVDEQFMPKTGCERISIIYDDHSYSICMSNKKIYVVKRRHVPSNLPETEGANLIV